MDRQIFNSDILKQFFMQNLLLESDLEMIEMSGVDIKHIETISSDTYIEPDYFENEILLNAKKMAELYAIYYCLENTIRCLISSRLQEKYRANWWEDKVPQGVKDNVKKVREDEKTTAMAIRSDDPIDYTNLGELIDIFNKNWADFSDTIRSQKAMQKTLSAFNDIRNVIAHSGILGDDDITRLKLLVRDWFRIQT
jgi:hypothetical protein